MFIVVISILAVFFLAAQTCQIQGVTTGIARDCVGENDIVCDDTEAYQCQLAQFGVGYYVTRAPRFDVECGGVAVCTTGSCIDGGICDTTSGICNVCSVNSECRVEYGAGYECDAGVCALIEPECTRLDESVCGAYACDTRVKKCYDACSNTDIVERCADGYECETFGLDTGTCVSSEATSGEGTTDSSGAPDYSEGCTSDADCATGLYCNPATGNCEPETACNCGAYNCDSAGACYTSCTAILEDIGGPTSQDYCGSGYSCENCNWIGTSCECVESGEETTEATYVGGESDEGPTVATYVGGSDHSYSTTKLTNDYLLFVLTSISSYSKDSSNYLEVLSDDAFNYVVRESDDEIKNVKLGTDSVKGNYLDFTSSSTPRYINFGTQIPKPTYWLSITADVKVDSNNLDEDQIIIAQFTDTCGYPLYSLWTKDGAYVFTVYIEGKRYQVQAGEVEDTWKTLTGTYDGNSVTLYMGGTAYTGSAVTGNIESTKADGDFVIGYSTICEKNQFRGSIDNLYVFGE